MKTKRLVAYFSCSSVTEKVAKTLSEAASADLFEIVPKKPYSQADLDWMNPKSRSSVEMKNPDFRPEIASRVENMSDYDTVFIGFPVWWYVAPTIINTFLESYDFSGKTIALFATSGGSGLGKTQDVLRPLVSPSAVWKPGKLLNGNPSQKALAQWVDGLNL